MKTYLKFPVYVEVTTGDVDRSKVSQVIREAFFPLLEEFLSKGKIQQREWQMLQRKLDSLEDLNILSEAAFLRKTSKPRNDSESFNLKDI
jgi:hypothetical protein